MQQQKSQEQFEELHSMWEHLRELQMSVEERLSAAEKTEPAEILQLEDSDGPGLRVEAPEFGPGTGGTASSSASRPSADAVRLHDEGGTLGADGGETREVKVELTLTVSRRRGLLHEVLEVTTGCLVQPSPYDGSSPSPYNGSPPWDAYKAQFEMLAKLNA